MKAKLLLSILVTIAFVRSIRAQEGAFPQKKGYLDAAICEIADSNDFGSTYRINKVIYKTDGKRMHTEKEIYIDLPKGSHFQSYYFDGGHGYYNFIQGKDQWIVLERFWKKPRRRHNLNQACFCDQFVANQRLKKLVTSHNLCRSVARSNIVVSFLNFEKIDDTLVQRVVSSVRKKL